MNVPTFCGAEEPLEPNPQMLTLDEQTGEIRVADFADINLNRYCFLAADTGTTADAILAMIVSRIIAAQQHPATLLIVWQAESQAVTPLRSKVLASKLKKAGWTIGCNELICIGAKALQTLGPSNLRPSELDERISGWAIVFGASPAVETLLRPPFLRSFSLMARTHLLCPSRDFLEGLKLNRLGIAYEGKDSLGRLGLVVVLPTRIETVLAGLLRDGVLTDIRRGQMAQSVWVEPPSLDLEHDT